MPLQATENAVAGQIWSAVRYLPTPKLKGRNVPEEVVHTKHPVHQKRQA